MATCSRWCLILCAVMSIVALIAFDVKTNGSGAAAVPRQQSNEAFIVPPPRGSTTGDDAASGDDLHHIKAGVVNHGDGDVPAVRTTGRDFRNAAVDRHQRRATIPPLTLLLAHNVFRTSDDVEGSGSDKIYPYCDGWLDDDATRWLQAKLLSPPSTESQHGRTPSPSLIRATRYEVRLQQHKAPLPIEHDASSGEEGRAIGHASSLIAVIHVPPHDLTVVDLPLLIQALFEAEQLLRKESHEEARVSQSNNGVRGQAVVICSSSGGGAASTCTLPNGITMTDLLTRLASPSYRDATTETQRRRRHNKRKMFTARRLVVGPSVSKSTAGASCHISNQGGLLGTGMHTPFTANLPMPTPPILMTRDVLQFMLHFFARNIIRELDVIAAHHIQHHGTPDVLTNVTTATNEHHSVAPAEDALPLLGSEGAPPPPSSDSSATHEKGRDFKPMTSIRRSPVAAACGVPQRIRALARHLYPFPLPPIALHHCLGLMLSGRDVQRMTFGEWEWAVRKQRQPVVTPQQQSGDAVLSDEDMRLQWMARLADVSSRSLRADDQMPYVWMTGDASFNETLTQELQQDGGGLPWRDEQSSGLVEYVSVYSMPLARDVNPQRLAAVSDDEAVIAAVYVPTRIDQFGMRDMVRCYHRSLEPRVRQRVALHFLLGARAAMDARFVFRGRGDVREGEAYFDEASGLTVWHRLALENCSRDFERRGDVGSSAVPGSGCPNGDVLLLDVIDLDRAPYTTKSHEKRMHGVTRASSTLLRRRHREPQSWHHVSEVSAMLIKLLVGMAHMVQLHPSSQFFVRGADDAYVSFRQVYVDALQLAARRSTTDEDGTHYYFGGHVVRTAILNVCGNFEVAKSGVLYRSGAIPRHRSLAPSLSPTYISGGGSVSNRALVVSLVQSMQRLPPHLWLEEDTMIGRLTAPLVLPTKDARFHNFFNATSRVDTAFSGSVPRAYTYCHPGAWVIHKYPAPGALYHVDANSLVMYCNAKDFAAARGVTHHCVATLNERFQERSRANTSEVGTDAATVTRGRGSSRWPNWNLGPSIYYSATSGAPSRAAKGGGPIMNRQLKKRTPCILKNMGMMFQHVPRDCYNQL